MHGDTWLIGVLAVGLTLLVMVACVPQGASLTPLPLTTTFPEGTPTLQPKVAGNPTATEAMATPAATAPVTATGAVSENLRVTLNDNNGTITMQVGERFLLFLGTGYDWSVTVEDQSIASRVVNILTVEGAQGVYEAHKPGQTTLNAAGDPVCRKATPPCGMPARLFRLMIVVR